MQNPGFGHILAVMAEVHARAGDIFTQVIIMVVIRNCCFFNIIFTVIVIDPSMCFSCFSQPLMSWMASLSLTLFCDDGDFDTG